MHFGHDNEDYGTSLEREETETDAFWWGELRV